MLACLLGFDNFLFFKLIRFLSLFLFSLHVLKDYLYYCSKCTCKSLLLVSLFAACDTVQSSSPELNSLLPVLLLPPSSSELCFISGTKSAGGNTTPFGVVLIRCPGDAGGFPGGFGVFGGAGVGVKVFFAGGFVGGFVACSSSSLDDSDPESEEEDDA